MRKFAVSFLAFLGLAVTVKTVNEILSRSECQHPYDDMVSIGGNRFRCSHCDEEVIWDEDHPLHSS